MRSPRKLATSRDTSARASPGCVESSAVSRTAAIRVPCGTMVARLRPRDARARVVDAARRVVLDVPPPEAELGSPSAALASKTMAALLLTADGGAGSGWSAVVSSRLGVCGGTSRGAGSDRGETRAGGCAIAAGRACGSTGNKFGSGGMKSGGGKDEGAEARSAARARIDGAVKFARRDSSTPKSKIPARPIPPMAIHSGRLPLSHPTIGRTSYCGKSESGLFGALTPITGVCRW
jgi:hypothetical protein